MYVDDDAGVVPQDFVVCDFYGVETCFCWNVNHSKLLVVSYATDDSTACKMKVLVTPSPVRHVQSFDGRIFVLCAPRGIYKLSRSGAFAVLSKNAWGMGAEFYEVLVAKEGNINLCDKQSKDFKPLFEYDTSTLDTAEMYSFPLVSANTEKEFFRCFREDEQEENVCLIGYKKKLLAWTRGRVRLIYADIVGTISRIMPIMRGDKVAGTLLLVNMDTIILVHSRDHNLVFQKFWLGRSVRCTSALCASFESENVLWIVYCDQSKLYYMEKELSTDKVQEAIVEERTFTCLQYYKSNVILGLLDSKELIEFPVGSLKNCLSYDAIELHTNMFQNTDLIMNKICSKLDQLSKLYETLADEQNKLRRINMYAYSHKIDANPRIEICKLVNRSYVTLNIPEKLPKNTHIVFTFNSKGHSIFCVKEITDAIFTVNMCVDKSRVLRSSTVNIDLITLMNKDIPWCIVQNFITCPLQKTRKRTKKEIDKTTFIESKIALLRNLVAENKLTLNKLSEIKKEIRAEF